LLAALPLLGVLPARAAAAVVQVRSNFYDPQEIHIASGDTVAWTAVDEGHTVTADDLRFDFYSTRVLTKGETVQFTFTGGDETVYFHCRVHAPAMYGVVIVGKGSPPPPPPPPNPPEVRAVPSAAYPTIARALDGAPTGSEIDIAPGIYREALPVATDGLVITGTGAQPSDVVVDGTSAAFNAFKVTAANVTIENLTVRGYSDAGISLDGARDYTIRNVRAIDTGPYGVRATASRGGVVENVYATDAATAGIAVIGCDPCDTIVRDSLAEANGIGLAATNASGLVVEHSTFRGNSTGVVLRSFAPGMDFPQRGAHVFGNVIEDNAVVNVPQPADALDISTGAGVHIAGGLFNVVEGNRISGHRYGVLVTGIGGASVNDRIASNVVERDARADLAWDGIGANVCFSGNATPASAEPSSDPPMIQTLYACDAPATAGVPNPALDADVLAYATRG
jgi:plastocyanin